MALYEYGDPAAPVLVCVHGYPDNAALWNPVAARLTDHFRVITYDVNGLNLYRANVVPRLLRPEPRRTDVPVPAVSPDGDAFVTTPLQTDVARWAPHLGVQVIRGGHWLPRNDPGLVARLTLQHTRRVAGWQV
ncbi:hypothetical protein [Kribbella sp. VKM Ac-2568]|uniref:hypothetical protein n=1 Tax=Kribbella sp. VKM Ac-2568 TaxID=2512219 RepID=UPI0010F2D14C|nr:hypothetical protein [Kribbella sp. VKM Ac-2568]TCM38159.1 hypothetical protein EV648_11731 [Kribbella sp. VKM Ac-2568]